MQVAHVYAQIISESRPDFPRVDGDCFGGDVFNRKGRLNARVTASGLAAGLMVCAGLLALPGMASAADTTVETYQADAQFVDTGSSPSVGSSVSWVISDNIGADLPDCSTIKSYALSAVVEHPDHLIYEGIVDGSVILNGVPMDSSSYQITTSGGPVTDKVTVTLIGEGIAQVDDSRDASFEFTFTTRVETESGGSFAVAAEATIGYAFGCPPAPGLVQPLVPTLQSEIPCDEEASVILPQVEGLSYAVSARNGNQVTVTATVDQGFTLAPGADVTWTLTIPDVVDCPASIDPPSETTNPEIRPTVPTQPTASAQPVQELAATGTGGTIRLVFLTGVLMAVGTASVLRPRFW